jgi:hypothetical protein
MKAGPRIATAVAIGYALGRTRKMKMAIAIGSMLAGRRLATHPGELLERGLHQIASSPQVSKLTGEVRNQVLEALKAAALAAASNKIDSLGDSLTQRADALRTPASSRSDNHTEDHEKSLPTQRDTDQDTSQTSQQQSPARPTSSTATRGHHDTDPERQ